jgi:hypothetical protein
MRAILITLIIANVAYFVYQEYVYQVPPTLPDNTVSSTDVKTISLLSELSARLSNKKQRDKEMTKVISNPVTVTVEEDAGNSGCMAIGPFNDLNSGQGVVTQLTALDLIVELKAVDNESVNRDYRVMIPPASSPQEAFRKLRELQSQNIDSYVISAGRNSQGISLGVFSTRFAAVALQEELQDAGYNPEIVDMPTLTREFWIFSTSERALVLDSDAWISLTANHPDLELRSHPCTSIKFKS